MLEDEDHDEYYFEAAEEHETPRKQIVDTYATMPSTKGKTQPLAEFEEDDISPNKSEVLVECSIPYKMKSLCTMASSTPVAATPDARSSTLTPGSRHQQAIDALQKALQDNQGELNYNELMKACNWRVRFQPSLGSLFTFLKKQTKYFCYKHAVVSLVPREVLVNELLALNWK